MALELILTPMGHLRAVKNTESCAGPSAALMRLERAFDAAPAAGLFALAAERHELSLPPPLGWWRDFAARYLGRLCLASVAAGADIDPVDAPTAAELEALALGFPPMPGAEYATTGVLGGIWRDLDRWVRGEVASGDGGLAGFLTQRAPLWHQVGRVCFHLAENRRDPDHPFAFLATYAPSLAVGGKVRYRPLGKALEEYAGQRNRKALIKLLTPVQRASEQSVVIRDLLESGDIYQPIAWTPSQAYRFLKDVPAFEESGVLVRLPNWWRKRTRPRVAVEIGSRKKSGLNAAGMLDFRMGVALGDKKLTKAEWQALKDADEGLVFLRGQWVEVDQEKLGETLRYWEALQAANLEGVSFSEGMRLLAEAPVDLGAEDSGDEERRQWSFVRAGPWLRDVLSTLRDPEGQVTIPTSRALKAELRPYQKVGVGWLRLLTRLGLGACLADDMGLGKTIQVLALLLLWKKERSAAKAKPSLLVLPASLLSNWQAEMERFAPSLRTVFVHPSLATKEEIAKMAEDPSAALQRADVVLTTYGMLLRQPWILGLDWRLVVLDEAQAIKNPAARQTRAAKTLRAEARIALTGTPVENRLSDLYSLFDFLCPGLLGSQAQFKAFVKSLERANGASYAPLRRLVQPYILRRMKTDPDIVGDLPRKTEVKAFCGLSRRQAVLYGGLVDELTEALESADGMKRRGLVLAYLLRFKQLCNHPSQLLDEGAFDPRESGKFERLAAICEEIASRGEKVLVFTQFRSVAAPLAGFLATVFGRDGLVLHGGTPVRRRRTLVEAFQGEDGPPFFVLSLKAGGSGLNLTAASHVIHFDRWWNPAVENQATDRAFRIGQQRNVMVHKFVCQGTVEERIDALIQEKTQLAEDLLGSSGETRLTEMADEDLIRIVSLDVGRAGI